MTPTKIILKYFLSIAKKKKMKMVFGKNQKTYFSDDSSQNCIEIFLINSKEEKNEDDFWQEPENIS